eukprot:scaffold74795_cov63-Phaeocystis_antarctica.AAC.2
MPRSPPTARPPRCCRPRHRRQSPAPTRQPSPPLSRPPHVPRMQPPPALPPPALAPPLPASPPLPLPPASPRARPPAAPPAVCRATPVHPCPRCPPAPRVAPPRALPRAHTAHRLRRPPAAPPPPALQPARRAWARRRTAGRAKLLAAPRLARRQRRQRGLTSSSSWTSSASEPAPPPSRPAAPPSPDPPALAPLALPATGAVPPRQLAAAALRAAGWAPRWLLGLGLWRAVQYGAAAVVEQLDDRGNRAEHHRERHPGHSAQGDADAGCVLPEELRDGRVALHLSPVQGGAAVDVEQLGVGLGSQQGLHTRLLPSGSSPHQGGVAVDVLQDREVAVARSIYERGGTKVGLQVDICSSLQQLPHHLQVAVACGGVQQGEVRAPTVTSCTRAECVDRPSLAQPLDQLL